MTDPAGFFADVYGDAKIASSQTGVPVSVVLAQWADETGYGTSSAWVTGHNYAGVSPSGRPASYPDRASGLAAYIKTLLLPYYDAVRGAGDPTAAARALGASPWAGGHYSAGGGAPGSDLLAIMSTNDLTRYDGAGGALPPLDAFGGGRTGVVVAKIPGTGIDLNPFNWGSDAAKGVAKLVATGVFILGGLALVVAGGWRSVAPSVQPVVDKAKKAAKVAAVA